MEYDIESLLAVLDLEYIERNLFRGQNLPTPWQRVYGGQVIAQSLTAAMRTVDDVACHSLHAYFLRPGDPDIPIIYEVDRARDGKSFQTRRVVAIQHGQQIFNMSASFQCFEEGLEHQIAMPDVPPPDTLMSDLERRKKMIKENPDKFPPEMRDGFLRKMPMELRQVNPTDMFTPEPSPPEQRTWFRINAPIADDPKLQQCLLAYMSDMTLLDSAIRPHGVSFTNEKLQVASLDHAMWFYHPVRVDEWILYAQSSPVSACARGMNFGNLFAHNGKLVCCVAQEGFMRLHK